MDSKQIQYILKIAECGNITKAAEQLYVSQPALSHFVAKTEAELGTKLFNRETTPLSLTEAGKEYVRTGKAILQMESHMLQTIADINELRSGTIRLGLSGDRAAIILPSVLPRFRNSYPNIRIEPVYSHSLGVEENVLSGQADIGIIPLYEHSPELETQVLFDEELVLCSAHELPSERGQYRDWVSIESLSGKEFVLLEKNNRLRNMVDAVFLEHGVMPEYLFGTARNSISYMLAANGYGLTIVPEMVTRMFSPARPARLYSLGKRGLHWQVGVVWRKQMVLNRAQEQLIRLIKNTI